MSLRGTVVGIPYAVDVRRRHFDLSEISWSAFTESESESVDM